MILTTVALAGDPGKAVKTLEKKGYELTADSFMDGIDNEQVKIVGLFLDAGMDPNSIGPRGKSALHHASQQADGAIAGMLIEAGADVNVTTEKGDTPLCEAADEEAHGSIAVLIAAGAELDTVCDWGKTALHIAADEGDEVAVKLLVDAGANIEIGDRRGSAALELAAGEGDVACVRLLLDAGADPNARNNQGGTALHEAISDRSLEVVELLLETGADARIPYISGDDPAERADSYGAAEIAAVLRAAPVVEQAAPTLDASLSSDEALTRLESLGIAFEPDAFFDRINSGDGKVVALFLSAGMSITVRDYQGRTPLVVAIDRQQAEIVDLLLAVGADPNDEDENPDPDQRYGETPIMAATDREDISIINALLAAGADVNRENTYGASAFDVATSSNKVELVSLYIEHGANVNKVYASTGGPCIWTPVAMGYVDVVRIMLEAGAVVGEHRAAMIESAAAYPEIIALLEETPE